MENWKMLLGNNVSADLQSRKAGDAAASGNRSPLFMMIAD